MPPHADIPPLKLAALAQAEKPEGLLAGFELRELPKGFLLSTSDCPRDQVFIVRTGHHNKFWEYFNKKRAGGSGPKPDELFLIHSHINQVRE